MINFKMHGATQAAKKFKKIQTDFEHKLGVATKAAAKKVESDAKTLAPYKTGTLRRSITTSDPIKSGGDVYCKVGTDVEYAPYQEYGTSRIPAHPYLHPALDANKGEIAEKIRDALKKAMG